MWRYTGKERPPFAVLPDDGQESVWDYPRPPSVQPDPREVIVRAGGVEIARTTSSVRVLETASPPTFYLPPHHVRMDLLSAASGASVCEWKGRARYWTLTVGDARIERVAWSYPDPLAFCPARLECFVGGIPVQPQPGPVLRRVDHTRSGGPVQRRAGHRGLVNQHDDVERQPSGPRLLGPGGF